MNGQGNWTTFGCTTRMESESGVVVCECNHLTNFAVLVVSSARCEDKHSPIML